jgi:hypothetical protein
LVCAHPKRLEIQAEFVARRSQAVIIARDYGVASRASAYRLQSGKETGHQENRRD